jgi:dTDP-L-rhamnose 4-epimerase
MRHAFITGGAGFIGSHVTTALLRAGFRVRILDSLSPQILAQVANAELGARE